MSTLAVAGHVRLEDLAVQEGRLSHLLSAEDSRNFEQRIDIIRAVEEGEAAREHSQENDTDTPHINRTRLLCTLEEHFRCTETTRTGSVGATAAARVVLRVAGSVGASGLRLCPDTMGDPVAAVLLRHVTSTGMPVCAFALGKTKINENAAALGCIIEKIGGFDVAVDDALCMYCLQCGEQTLEVEAHVRDLHVAVVVAEVAMLEVRQDSDNLIEMTEGGDERTYRVRISQVVEEFQLVEYAYRTARDVDLLDGYIVGSFGGLPWVCRRHPFVVLALFDVPVVAVVVVLQILCLVHC